MYLKNEKETHAILIGAGIMSATLAVILRRLNPDIKITMYERLDQVSCESSDAMNNAGTGHSGFCELNYTPEDQNGEIDITKAVKVASEFEISKEFWAYLIETGFIKDPKVFIRRIPHMSFVWGEDDVNFLEKRWKKMIQHPLFKEMKFSKDREQLKEWIPLIIEHRDKQQPIAATRMEIGADVNYGALTRTYVLNLLNENGVILHLAHEVLDLKREGEKWQLKVRNLTTGRKTEPVADFVFIGAGGAAIQLLDKSGIEEAEGYGGFPVSGEWLICNNEDIIKRHSAKVYGKAKIGAPPMSVPHLDSRMINGKLNLLFGPFAGFSTKFLKNGSYWDLPLSIAWSNIKPMIAVGLHNIPLTKYLIEQVTQNKEDKIESLKEFFPDAKYEDWDESIAGQRVQIIKKDEKEGGILEFGTEIVDSADGTIAALLGASPGASTAVYIMLDLLEKCFPENAKEWTPEIQKMIPSYKNDHIDAQYIEESRKRTSRLLGWEMQKITPQEKYKPA
ncbi:MAG: malate dehydrogenase (quinone) [Chitinophagaceae bacterium]|nr:malate dehydrogenase (quinone) [Chitinophagaceae bacterium]